MSAEQSPGPGARGSTEVIEPTPAQRAFARGVAESKATIPHVYFEASIAARPSLPEVVRAAATALRELPLLNGAYRDGHFERYQRINVAVGLDAGETVAFPVVHDADRFDDEAIASMLGALAEGARAGTLASPAYAGATFTVIDMSDRAQRFAPVINHGQAATLGVGAEALTMACDNRLAQVGEGGALLSRIVSLLAG